MIRDVMVKCSTDSNPDAWFPELPQGARSNKKMALLGQETARAISLCNSCPEAKSCLEEGMEPKNLAHGIWGGLLASERLDIADSTGVEYMANNIRTRGTRIQERTTAPFARHIVLMEPDSVTVEDNTRARTLYRVLLPWIRSKDE
jgi:hypothetical protein